MTLLTTTTHHSHVHAAASPSNTIFEVSLLLAQHALDGLEDSHAELNRATESLSHEYESSRSLRLLLKLGFLNKLSKMDHNKLWSETGDCYVLKLFRDYVFHKENSHGQPRMDLGHVITALNKLDMADADYWSS